MRSIRISDEIWNVIFDNGVFGETPNDVLERLLLKAASGKDESSINADRKSSHTKSTEKTNKRGGYSRSSNKSIYRLTPSIQNKVLTVSISNGARMDFALPEKQDIDGIRAIRNQASQFAKDNFATEGQINAVRKALTEEGYYVRGKQL